MTIHEHQRYSLHQALGTHLGPENAATLMAYLPPVGWADVATKDDLTALEQRIGLRLTTDAIGRHIGFLLPGQESALAEAIRIAYDLY